MPNEDITISANWVMDTKYYFTIKFDPSNKPGNRNFSTSPTTPAEIRWLDGTTLPLTDSQYQLTCKTQQWYVIYTKTFNYKSDGWSYTSSTSTSGGGQNSIVIDSSYAENGVITLYPCWLEQ